MAAKKGLSDKHEQFCLEYVKDLNATQAYARTYPDASPETADANGPKLLGNARIKERISELKAKRAKKTEITAERVLQEIATTAFAHIGLVADIGTDGSVTLKEQKKMGKNIRALHSLQQDEIYNKDGELVKIKNKFTMHDKLRALELLSKHLGLLDGDAGSGGTNKRAAKSRLGEALTRLAKRIK